MVAKKKGGRKAPMVNKQRKIPRAQVQKMVYPLPAGNKQKSSKSEDATRIARHVAMIMDPCNAELGPTAYRGADGFITRFRNVVTISPVATKTGFAYVWYPAYNRGTTVNANSGDPFAFNPNFDGPGQTFLLNQSDTQRAVGACTTLNYTGTELDRCGIVYSGVVPIATLQNIKTLADIALVLQHEQRVSDKPIEVKWSPSAAEEEYFRSNLGSIEPPNAGDRNCIVFIVLGTDPTTSSCNFSLINTLISEWRPEAGSGISTPNPSSHDVPGGIEKVRSILQRMGNWWFGAAKTAYNVASSPTGRTIAAAVAAML